MTSFVKHLNVRVVEHCMGYITSNVCCCSKTEQRRLLLSKGEPIIAEPYESRKINLLFVLFCVSLLVNLFSFVYPFIDEASAMIL